MYLSISKTNNKKIKYFIIDQSEEFNIPNIPSGFTLAFQEKYSSNIKILNDEELRKVFSNNTILYEIINFDSSLKITEKIGNEFINKKIKEFISPMLKITESLSLNILNINIINFTKISKELYNKNEVNNLFSTIQNKINNINEKLNIVRNIQSQSINKNEIYNQLNLLTEKLNAYKEKIINDKL